MAANSFRLRTFGGLQLERADGQRVLGETLRRRLLLVALAADAGDRGVSRDRVIGLFWPESDEERGRRSLNQLRYTLRQQLSADLVIGTTTLRVDPGLVETDVEAFRAAVARGDADAAAAIQVAPFLDGVFAEGAPALDQWVEDRRRELQASLEAVLLRSARSAIGQDSTAALSRWRRLLELDPLNSVYAVGAMEAMASWGDATGALVVAERHEAAVLRELGVPPDRAVAETAARIRGHTRPVRSLGGVHPAGPEGPSPSLDTRPGDGPVSAPLAKPGRRRWATLAGGTLAAVGITVLMLRGAKPEMDAGSPPQLVIGIDVAGEATSASDRLLEPALHRAAGGRELPPTMLRATLQRMRRSGTGSSLDDDAAREVAHREGLPWVVVGRVSTAGARVSVRYQIEDAAGGRMLRTREEVAPSPDRLHVAVDRLADRLADDLRALGPGPGPTPMPYVTTSSLEALRAYQGSSRLVASGDRSHISMLERAVALDSAFPAAHAQLAYSYWFSYDHQRAERHAAAAERSLAGLDARERLWVTRDIANAREDWPAAIASARALVERERQQSAWWHALGQLLYFDGQYARSIEAYDSAMAHAEADDSLTLLVNRATVLARIGRLRESEELYRQAFRLDSLLLDDPFVYLEYGTVLVHLGRPAEARRVFQRPVAGTARDRAGALRALALLDAFEGRYQQAIDLLEESATASSAVADSFATAVAHMLLAEIRLLSGDTAAARAELRTVGALADRTLLSYEVLSRSVKLAARAGGGAAAGALLARLESQTRARSSTARARLLMARGEVELAAGRVAEGRRMLEQAHALDRADDLLESSAHAARLAGLTGTAAARYDSLASSEGLDWDGYAIRGLGRYQAAEAWELAGDSAKAAAAYRNFVTGWGGADRDLAPVRRARQRMDAVPTP